MRVPQADHRDYDLPPGGQRVALIGPARTLVWPALCPNCGEPASSYIRVYKTFRHKTRRRPWRYYIRSIEIPYCARCIRDHESRVEPPGPLTGWLSVFRSPLLIPVVGATTMLWLLREPLLDLTGTAESRLMALGIAGLLLFVVVLSVIQAWWSYRFHRMPPQTDVTRACDYSDNLGDIIVGERRVFAIRNRQFAEAFAMLNRDRLYTDELRARDRRRQAIASVIALVVLVLAWWLLSGRK